MIQLKKTADGFELKNQNRKLDISNETIKLGDQTINSSGEYEVEGIEVIYGQQAVLIIWDQLEAVYVFNPGKPTNFEKNQFAPCDAVIVGFKELEDKNQLNEILETYDPRLVFAASEAKSLIGAVGATNQETDSYKLNTQALPEEGREFILL